MARDPRNDPTVEVLWRNIATLCLGLAALSGVVAYMLGT